MKTLQIVKIYPQGKIWCSSQFSSHSLSPGAQVVLTLQQEVTREASRNLISQHCYHTILIMDLNTRRDLIPQQQHSLLENTESIFFKFWKERRKENKERKERSRNHFSTYHTVQLNCLCYIHLYK